MAENLSESNQPVSERQRAMEGQLSELAQAVKALEARLAEAGRTAAAFAPKETAPQKDGEVTPEILVVIAAAVTKFLGKKVRIRSAKLLQQRTVAAGAWAQQGRAAVHGSHHPRLRG
ncbi:MAG: hypothetical protein WB424_17540 [Terracidiphilus sp.]